MNLTNPRPYHALSLRIKGDATFTSDSNIYHVSTNDIIYIPKDLGYKLTANTEETVFVIHFDIIDNENRDISAFTPINPAIFRELFEKMYMTWTKRRAGYEYKLFSYFYNILANIDEQKFSKVHRTKRLVDDILDYMSANFTSNELTVEHIAKNFDISTVYLQKMFKNNLNTSPLKYLNDRRIQYASSLLETGHYSVKEVSEMSGFSDVKYFSTCFKKHTGITPMKKKQM